MRIVISIPEQSLTLYDAMARPLARYAVSTAANGPGEQRGSYCTPRGAHRIRARVGAGAAPGTVFVRRRPTGEIWSPELAAAHPRRDWILTRILWLCGREPGRNRFGAVDTQRRYIYIHGTPETTPLGQPGSKGCIRMRNDDLIALFDQVAVGTRVDIDDFRVDLGDWTSQREAAIPVRTTVFVGEQGVPAAIELDAMDAVCVHAVARDADGTVLGTGRLLPDGHIGRMAVHAAARGRGVGRALLCALHEAALARGMNPLRLNAQTHACGFYAGFGYRPEGAEFFEAGLPHQSMCRDLTPEGAK